MKRVCKWLCVPLAILLVVWCVKSAPRPRPKISKRTADYLVLNMFVKQMNAAQTNFTLTLTERTNTP